MIVVVEAHADDAYLSVGAFLRAWAADEPILLVTVFSGTRRRARDAEAYADAIGADWLGLGLVEAGTSNVEGVAALPGGVRDDLVALLGSNGVTMLGPLGLGHPEHRAVAETLPPEARRYVDLPIASRRRVQPELLAKTEGRRVVAIRVASARDFGEHGLFKDQARFMYFNPPAKLSRLPQAILR